MKSNKILGYLLVVIVGIAVLSLTLYILTSIYPNATVKNYHLVFDGILIAVGGIILTNLFSSFISNKVKEYLGESTAGLINFVIRIVGYITVAVLFLSFFRVNIASALVAGGFAGVIIGLASQSVLSNVFGAIAILISRPFRLGDRITLSTWQYGLIAPSYPPKFFSNDFLIPGYTGKVIEISLMYTTILTDDNMVLKIPNSVMIQSSIFIHSLNESRVIRSKIEVSKEIDPDDLIPEIYKNIKGMDLIVGEPDVHIYETTFTTYILVIQGTFKSQFEEPIRSEVLKRCMAIIKEKSGKSKA